MNQEELFFEKETRLHQQEVAKRMMQVVQALLGRAPKHDASKLEDPERSVFIEYTPKLKGSTYGSDEYKTFLKEMKVALDHHYSENRHHPEFHGQDNPMDGMNLLDLIEMLCDWMAAVKRHANGDIGKSIEINEKRFAMTPQLAQILRNTVKEIEP